MTPDELSAIEAAFTRSLEPMVIELRGIHGVLNEHSNLLNEHSRLLNEHSQLLRNIDGRRVRVEGLLDGVEILVRSRTGRTG